MTGNSHHETLTACGKEAVLKLTELCFQKIVTASAAAATADAYWVVVPPPQDMQVLLDGKIVETEYLAVSPHMAVTAVGPRSQWTTAPTFITREVPDETPSSDHG